MSDDAIARARAHAQKLANETGETHVVYLVHYASAGYGLGYNPEVLPASAPPPADRGAGVDRYATVTPKPR